MPANADHLLPGEALWAGQSITSPNGRFTLHYQHDANLVLYKNFWDRPRAWIWDSETNGHPVHVCAFQGDGNLVIYRPDGEPIWDTGTWVQPQGQRLTVRDNGTVVITQWAGYTRWSRGYAQGPMAPIGVRASGDDIQMGESIHPGDRLTSANGEYTLHFQPDRNVVLTWNVNGQRLWATNTAGSYAETLILRRDGNLALYRGNGDLLWATYTYANGSPLRMVVQGDGNLVLLRADGSRAWQSQTAAQPLPQGPSAHGTHVIRPGQVLRPGESLRSANGAFSLYYQREDGNLLVYRHGRDVPWRALWGTGTVHAPAGAVSVRPDGQFAVYDAAGRVAWNATAYRHPAVNGLVLHDDGNLVLYYNGTSVLWSTGISQPCPPYGPTATGSDMAAGELLYPGKRLSAAGGLYTLEVETAAGPVLYRNPPGMSRQKLWSLAEVLYAGTDQLMLHPDGVLAVYRADGAVLWTSRTGGQGGARLLLRDDGNLQLERADGFVVWQTGTGRTLPAGPPAQGDAMLPGQTLAPGAELHSADGRYALVYQADGNLVLYKNIRAAPRVALWATGTGGWRPGVVHLGHDGNLRVYNQFVDLQWESGTAAASPEALRLQTDGNLVVYGDGEPLWASDTVQPDDPGDLVERFAPEVRLHPDDEFRPSSVEWFLPRAELWIGGDLKLGVGAVNEASLVSQFHDLQESGAGYPTDFHLQTPHSSTHRGDLGSATCYAHVITRDDGGKDIQYWFFYPYNGDLVKDSTLGIMGLLTLLNPIFGPLAAAFIAIDRVEHEADWEHVTVRLTPDEQVEKVYFSAHHGEGDWFDADQVQFNEHGRPVVFSAWHSHASYPTVGDRHREGALDLFVPDHTADGGPVWRTWERLERMRTETGEEPQPWLRYSGLWGEPGSLPFSLNKGPRGPLFQESWHGDRARGSDEILLKGWMLFREDNAGGGDIVGRTTDAPRQVIRIPHRMDWTNDEARSLQLFGVREGTIITVYDDTDGDTSDPYSRITVKQDVQGMVQVNTFRNNYEDDTFRVQVLRSGDLDGKVSRVTVQHTSVMGLPLLYGGGGGSTGPDPDRPPVHVNAVPEEDPDAGTTGPGTVPEPEAALA